MYYITHSTFFFLVNYSLYLFTGDIHLAIFRVSKLEETVEAPSDSDGSKAETDSPTENT